MSRNMKIVLIVIAAITGICCLLLAVAAAFVPRMMSSFAENAFVEDPEAAAEVGESIVDYQLPPGYQEEMAMNIVGTRMVVIAPTNRTGVVIMLMQLPGIAQLDPGQMQQQMEEAFSQQTGEQNFSMQTVATEEVTINGQATTLTRREGTNEQGEQFRQVTIPFQGKSGAAMMMIMGEPGAWDEEAVDRFITSME